jgi:hypothetical protein
VGKDIFVDDKASMVNYLFNLKISGVGSPEGVGKFPSCG